MKIYVTLITTTEALNAAHQIRKEVFVVEQNVPEIAEIDEFEDESRHFLASYQGQPVGTARWRFNENGIKLERFAVVKPMRGKKVGDALMNAILDDISQHPQHNGQKIYLHAQLSAVGFYEKFAFQRVGEVFDECDILHSKMEKFL